MAVPKDALKVDMEREEDGGLTATVGIDGIELLSIDAYPDEEGQTKVEVEDGLVSVLLIDTDLPQPPEAVVDTVVSRYSEALPWAAYLGSLLSVAELLNSHLPGEFGAIARKVNDYGDELGAILLGEREPESIERLHRQVCRELLSKVSDKRVEKDIFDIMRVYLALSSVASPRTPISAVIGGLALPSRLERAFSPYAKDECFSRVSNYLTAIAAVVGMIRA